MGAKKLGTGNLLSIHPMRQFFPDSTKIVDISSRDAPIANFGADRRSDRVGRYGDLPFKVMFKTQLMGLIHWSFHKQPT